MKIISFFNNKGGVGKTTLAVNVASYISTNFGKKVLFLDADPQSNSTQMIVEEEKWDSFYGENPTNYTIMDYLMPIQEGDSGLNFDLEPYSWKHNRFQFDLIPGHPRLSIIEDILSDSWNKSTAGDLGGFRKTNWLKALQEHYNEEYDYLIIDLGPSLGALNRSILLNSNFFVTPMGSDIFSLIGISNISSWIRNWLYSYKNGINTLKEKYEDDSINKFPLNLDPDKETRFVGFSVQQYVTKSFSTGRRPVSSYERIISKIPEAIEKHLSFLIFNNLTISQLNLGDVPYLYSLVPLAQSSKAPIYSLTYSDGLVGSQPASVKKYAQMLNDIASKILRNIGD